MFDGLLKSKFYTKCKSGIKLTRTRIEMILKKRNSMQNYLRNDVADLLKKGLNINAFERAEGLLVELNRSSCYEFIEQSSLHVLNHLAVMSKQRECPEECWEAISSLTFAAARFSDLPELRELRTLFSERYGNSLDFYVSKQFVEKMNSGLPSKDTKIQLLHDIASEYGLRWNSKDLQNKLHNEPACEKNSAKEIDDSERTLVDGINNSARNKECSGIEYELKNPRKFTTPERIKDHQHKEVIKVEDKFSRKTENVAHSRDRQGHQMAKGMDEVSPIKDIQMDAIGQNEKRDGKESLKRVSKVESHQDRAQLSKAEEHYNKPRVSKDEERENNSLTYKSIPPPYFKSEVNQTKIRLRDSTSNKQKVEVVGAAGFADRQKNNDEDDSVSNTKRVPKSVRSRHLKPPIRHENAGDSEGDKIDRAKQNQEKAGEAQRIIKFLDEGGRDLRDDEKNVDKLLLHYCKRKGPHQKTKSVSVLKPPSRNAPAPVDSNRALNRNRDVPNRTTSLPCEITSPTESPRFHARASSFNPEILNGNMHAHVHPKLPDYDDFVAKLASLRGRN